MSTLAEPEVPTSTASAIVEYSATEAALNDLRRRYENVVFDVATTKGDKAARAARLELVTLRTSLEKKRAEIKAPALERCRVIDAEAKRITAAIMGLEVPIDAQIKAEEERKEREKREREEAERKRVAEIRARIDLFANLTARAATMDAAEIQERIERLDRIQIGEDYAEFREEAIGARRAAVLTLTQLRDDMLELERKQEQVRQEREALERERAAEEERIRLEREAEARRIAEARAEEEARLRAERERQQAELRAEREKQEQAAAVERARIAEQERIAAEARAEEEARLQALAEALKREREEMEARRRAEQAEEEARQRAKDEQLERQRAHGPALFIALSALWDEVESHHANFPDPPIASETTIALVEDALQAASGE